MGNRGFSAPILAYPEVRIGKVGKLLTGTVLEGNIAVVGIGVRG